MAPDDPRPTAPTGGLPPVEPPPEGLLSGPYRRVTLAVLATIAIASYNNLSVSAALPAIGDDLGDVGLLPWTITVELLAASVAVLVAGPVIDGLGVRRTFRGAVVAFTAASVACAAAPSLPVLVATRAAQGLTAGVVIAVGVAATGLAFPDRLRPRAYAANSAVWGVMGVAGPAVAALVLTVTSWRGVFLVNVPVAMAAGAVGWRVLPDRRGHEAADPFDVRGTAVVVVFTVAALALASGRIPVIVAPVTLAAGWAYVVHARRHRHPVVRLAHLTARRWRHLHLVTAAALAGGVGANALLPVYLRGARATSTALAAFSVLFLTVGWTSAAWVSSRLQDRHRGERVAWWGALLLAPASVAAAVTVLAGVAVPLVFVAFFALGGGVGMVSTSALATLQGRARASEMGRVSSAHQFLRTLAISYGTAVAGAVLFAVVAARTGDVSAVRDLLGGAAPATSSATATALADGYGLALGVLALVCVAALAPARVIERDAAAGPAHAAGDG
ncbi:MAG: MFS transporter [Actinomyces sp.]|nr:MAG: MFS transporter [Actinomyces sp.]